MSLPMGLSLYRTATRLMGPFVPQILNRRARQGKELPTRLPERFGQTTHPRPEGRLVWIHGASVGESLVSLMMRDALLGRDPGLKILLTSGTLTSAKLIEERSRGDALHQFLPVDRLSYVDRFLEHWQPDLAVFVESEVWPNLILETARRGTRMALVNARMNEKSLSNWQRFEESAKWLLACFDWIGAADERTASGLSKLTGDTVEMVGNLKLSQQPAALDQDRLNKLKALMGDRPVWLAASTHEGEEEIILQAHQRVLESNPGTLLILVPRHPERGSSLTSLIETKGFNIAVRSNGQNPDANTQVWLADTLGEMAYWYTLAPVSLIAGSLKPGIGGHNPIEASQAGTGIMTGPHTASFDDVYKIYDAHQARDIVKSAGEICQAVDRILTNAETVQASSSATLDTLKGDGLEQTLDALMNLVTDEEV